MSAKTLEIPQQEDILLLNKLTRSLEEQINIIQCSDISGKKVEVLAIQIQSIVDEITCKGLLDLEQFKDKREQIVRLYNNLNLAVIARSNETKKQLQHISKGKKTLVTYRNNISVENNMP